MEQEELARTCLQDGEWEDEPVSKRARLSPGPSHVYSPQPGHAGPSWQDDEMQEGDNGDKPYELNKVRQRTYAKNKAVSTTYMYKVKIHDDWQGQK